MKTRQRKPNSPLPLIDLPDEKPGHAFYIFNPVTQQIYYANKLFLDLLGYTLEQLTTLTLAVIIDGPREKRENHLHKLLEISQLNIASRRYIHKNKSLVDVETSLSLIPLGGETLALAIVDDLTGKKHLEVQQQMAAKVFESAYDGIVITNAQGIIQIANPAFLKTTGYSLTEVTGKTLRIVRSNKQDDAFYTAMWQTLKTQGQWNGEIWNCRKNGDLRLEWLTISSITDDTGKMVMYVGIYRDLTNRLHYQETMKFQAQHDTLTGLPNRLLFQETLTEKLKLNQPLALLFLDLDGFKTINDTLGHDIGDILLQQVAERISSAVTVNGMVARLGGDEFTIILYQLLGHQTAYTTAENIRHLLEKPFIIDDKAMTITASIGISLFPVDGTDRQELMKAADMAMYKAKTSGKNQICFFSTSCNKSLSSPEKAE